MLYGIVVKSLFDTQAERCFISHSIYKYFSYKKMKHSKLVVHSAQGSVCVNNAVIDLNAEIRSVETVW